MEHKIIFFRLEGLKFGLSTFNKGREFRWGAPQGKPREVAALEPILCASPGFCGFSSDLR